MANIKHHKFVASLPAVLEADSIYFVRVGSGYDQYVTNHSGQIVAYPMNQQRATLRVYVASGARALIPLDANGELPIQLADGSSDTLPLIGARYV